VAAIIFVPKAIDKYHEHQEALAAADRAAKAAAEAAKVPPDPAMDEILRKVDDTYKALTSYSAHADSVGTMDMSEISPLLKAPQTITAKLTILLSKPNLYRIEWERQAGPTTLKGMAWSSGKGDFVRAGTASTKYKSREMALTIAAASSGTLGASLAGLFFDPTNSLANGLKNPSKGKNETINGHKCYVISGQIAFQNLKLWIRKDDFMITQAEVVLGGKIDDSMLANLPAAQKAQMMQASKIKGNIIETYQDIETNRVLNPSDFEKALAANGASGTPGNSGTPKPVRGPKDQAKGLRDRRQ
jgi:outer membrane lipoprotein-sorting protein